MKRNGLEQRTPLRAYTPLKRSHGLKMVSVKQQAKNKEWRVIFGKRVAYLVRKYDMAICEYCGKTGVFYQGKHDDLMGLDPHHINHNRNNNTPENCHVTHRLCHGKIEDNNIAVVQEGFEGMRYPSSGD